MFAGLYPSIVRYEDYAKPAESIDSIDRGRIQGHEFSERFADNLCLIMLAHSFFCF